MSWETSDPNTDWETYKEEYWEQDVSRLRAPHLPIAPTEYPPLQTNQAQIVAYLTKPQIRYDKYGDMKVTFSIPGQFTAQAHRLYGLTDRLLSIDIIAMPDLDPDQPLEGQLDDEWWKR